jgi:hypothetical protein
VPAQDSMFWSLRRFSLWTSHTACFQTQVFIWTSGSGRDAGNVLPRSGIPIVFKHILNILGAVIPFGGVREAGENPARSRHRDQHGDCTCHWGTPGKAQSPNAVSRETCRTYPHNKPSGQRLVCMKFVSAVFLIPSLLLLGGCEDASSVELKPSSEDEGVITVEPPEEQVLESTDEPPVEDSGEPSSTEEEVELEDTGDFTEPVDEPEDLEPEEFEPTWPEDTDPFADAVVAFEPGPDAGFGAEFYPEIVLGPPEGGGSGVGSMDVLSLGELGSIVLEFSDLSIVDGPGADLLVFENPFSGWIETAHVEASIDGETWFAWPCEPENAEDDFPGCAGVASVYATGEFLVDPTDPVQAGGDAFDLADIGLETARFVRITDSGFNAFSYGGITGGFDLDAVVAANWMDTAAD